MNDLVILAIDAGTTGVQTALFQAPSFSMLGSCKVEFPQVYPAPGLVEHDPYEIWFALLESLKKTFAQAQTRHPHFTPSSVACVGLTNQRETCCAWDRHTGQVLGRAIVWQDRRTTETCMALRENQDLRDLILHKTGLVCDPYFSASKMQWMHDNRPEVRALWDSPSLALGTIDAFLVWKLTQGEAFVTDHTNACRTMLYGLESGTYEEELLTLFGIPRGALPQLVPSMGPVGYTRGLAVIPDGIPITGLMGDQQSALFGQNAIQPGQAKVTYGTGAFLLVNTGYTHAIPHGGLLSSVAYTTQTRRTFCLEGSAFIAGAAVQYVRDNLGWIVTARDSEAFATKHPRDENVVFVPAFSGLGAPYWNPHAKAVLLGLSRGTSKHQIMRAILESIALQNVQLLKLMEEASDTPLSHVYVDGGMSANNFLMQFQSDVLQLPLHRPTNIETTLLGAAKAAYLGFMGCEPEDVFGGVQDRGGEGVEPARDAAQGTDTFTPHMDPETSKRIVKRWTRTVKALNQFYTDWWDG